MSTDTSVDATTESSPTRILDVTPEALEKVLEIRSGEDDADTLALRVEVVGVAGVEYQYDLAFEPIAEATDDDFVYAIDDLQIMIPTDSTERLAGSTLALPSNPAQQGLVIRNPNRPDPLGDIGDLELTGETAEKVQQLLDARINPMLASHGGFATLRGVEGSVVYVTMGGGCQGCSMSAMTLTEGIRTAILQHIPEVTEVVDATDHDAGENPYYDN